MTTTKEGLQQATKPNSQQSSTQKDGHSQEKTLKTTLLHSLTRTGKVKNTGNTPTPRNIFGTYRVCATRESSQREKSIESRLVSEAKKRRDCKTYKFESPGQDGVPDRILIAKGHVYFIETKRPKNGRLEKRQAYVHKEMQQAGADVRVIKTIKGIEDLMVEVDQR